MDSGIFISRATSAGRLPSAIMARARLMLAARRALTALEYSARSWVVLLRFMAVTISRSLIPALRSSCTRLAKSPLCWFGSAPLPSG